MIKLSELYRLVVNAVKRVLEEKKWRDQLVADLKRHEGLRLKAYLDTVGVWTIGYGHTGPEVTPGLVITEGQAEDWLRQDILEAVEDASIVFTSLAKLDPVRMGVIVNMAFNLGRSGLNQFNKQSLPAIRDGRYEEAAELLKKSLWARQTKSRAAELIERIRTGTIDPKHLV